MEIEVELAAGAAEPADIDDAALDSRGRQVLVGELAGDLVYHDQVDAFAVRCFQDLVDPAGIGRIHREIGAEFPEPAAAIGIGGGADHGPGTLEFGDLQRHKADAGAGALDQHRLAGLTPRRW